jgi:hypothetical protein
MLHGNHIKNDEIGLVTDRRMQGRLFELAILTGDMRLMSPPGSAILGGRKSGQLDN